MNVQIWTMVLYVDIIRVEVQDLGWIENSFKVGVWPSKIYN